MGGHNKARYASDEAYRQLRLKRTREWRETVRNDPLWITRQKIIDRMRCIRNTRENLEKRLAALEKELVREAKDLLQIETRWKDRRKARRQGNVV